MGLQPILAISDTGERELVWDIQTDCHTYFADGVLVHNCDFPNHYKSCMDAETCVQTVARLKTWGTQAVVLTGGGEPTVHPNWQGIANDWSQHFQLGMYTNGIKLDLAPCEKAFRWVYVSLDAPDEKAWSENKGVDPGLFRKVLANIEAASYYATVGVGFLIGEDNVDRVEEMAILGLSTNPAYVHFRPRFPVSNNDWESDARVRLGRVATMPRVSVAWERFEHGWHWTRPYSLCWASMFIRQIDTDGNVYACPTTRWLRKIGHVSDFTPLTRPLPVIPACRELCRGDGLNRVLNPIMRAGPHDCFV